MAQIGQIKRYGEDGSFLGTVGRPGQGPMEFQRLTHLYIDGQGNVRALDPGNARETVLSPEGEMVAERPAEGLFHHLVPLPGSDRVA